MFSGSKFAHLWDNVDQEDVNSVPNHPPLTSDQDGSDFTELFSAFGFEPAYNGVSLAGTSSSNASATERTLSSSSSSSWNSDRSVSTANNESPTA